MNNILFIGPYREFTGIGNASRKYIQALVKANYNVTCRPLFNTIKPIINQEIDPVIFQCEKNIYQYDTIIQHAYPHQLYHINKYKNIAIIPIDKIGYGQDMYEYTHNMDEIWVGSTVSREEVISWGIEENKIKIVPEFLDLSMVSAYKEKNKRQNTRFVFYTIADFTNKKNLQTLILAFFILSIEFPNIELLIKTKNTSNDSSNLNNILNYEIDKILQNLNFTIDKRNTYPKLIIGETKYDNILYIHNNCDCYIDISSGESFGYPVLEAMSFNNQIIINKNSGSCDIVKGTSFYPVDSSSQNSNDNSHPYWIYNSINQKYFVPELNSLVLQMKRAVTESVSEKLERQQLQNNKVINYSIDNIKSFI
jgi:glycosyltransferase involved in cell wall biosynthesis